MRSEMSGSGYAFFTVFAFNARSPGPVGDFHPSSDEEYRSCHWGFRGTDPARCQILLNEGVQFRAAFGDSGYTLVEDALLRAPAQ